MDDQFRENFCLLSIFNLYNGDNRFVVRDDNSEFGYQ